MTTKRAGTIVNRFPHQGKRRGNLLTWAQDITEEAFAIDPVFMEECALKIFGHDTGSWTATETTEPKIHTICQAAMLVRLQAGAA